MCIKIAEIMARRNKTFCFLSKGYGGRFNGVIRVSDEKASVVGDEPLILHNYGDVFVAKNRVAGLKYINNNFDYDYIIMDDGLQNPTFIKDKIILVLDGMFGFGNGFILPAGALRDKIENIYKTIDIAIVTNPADKITKIMEKYGIKFISAKITALNEVDKNTEYVAFCGLGRPEKFEKTLIENNLKLKKFVVFGDHHFYSKNDMKMLYSFGSKLITTEKDWVKLSEHDKKMVDFLAINITLNEDLLGDIL
jgi:tetraacyldisaccharide 4'-kinase